MKHRHVLRNAVGALVPVLLVLSLVGCIRSRPASFFTLQPVLVEPAPTAVTSSDAPVLLGVGPVSVPGYMERPQIVTRLDRNEVQISERNRWAANVSDSIPEVLQDNLTALMPGVEVLAYRVHSYVTFTHQLAIQIDEFLGSPDGEAILDVEWYLVELAQTAKRPARKRAVFRRPVQGGDHADVVSAMSLLLGDLSEAVAKDLRSQE